MSVKCYDFYEYQGYIDMLIVCLQDFRRRTLLRVKKNIRLFADEMDVETIAQRIERDTKFGFGGFFDIGASAIVVFHKGKIYVKFFGVPVKDIPKDVFLDKHYQDQTDRPETISQEEWDDREALVETLFGSVDTYAQGGLTYNFCSEQDAYRIAFEVKNEGKNGKA